MRSPAHSLLAALALALCAFAALARATESCPTDQPSVFFGNRGYLTFADAYGPKETSTAVTFRQMSMEVKLRLGSSAGARKFSLFSVSHTVWIDSLDVSLNVNEGLGTASVEVAFQPGKGLVTFSASVNGLLDGEWHLIEVTTSPLRVFIYFDTALIKEQTFFGSSLFAINVNGNAKIGGTRLDNAFDGCIRNLVFEQVPVDIRTGFPTGSLANGCSFPTTARFLGDSFVQTYPLSSRLETDIRFEFQLTSLGNMLLYHQAAGSGPKLTYVTIQTLNGQVRATILLDASFGPQTLTSTLATPLSLDTWYSLRLTRFGNSWSFVVQEPTFIGLTGGFYGYAPANMGNDLLNSYTTNYFGGHPSVISTLPGVAGSTVAFSGFIRNLFAGGSPRALVN